MSKCINKECKDWDIDYEEGCSGLGIRHDGHLCSMYIPENESGQVEPIVMPRFSYDEKADVMYISFGEPKKCKTNEMDDGLLHRYTLREKLNGITITNYSRRVA